jgi:RNA polymerase sigma factor (sigma-70 family)
LSRRAPSCQDGALDVTVFENNRALLDGFRAGRRDALAAVYERYVDDVARLVRAGFTVTTADGPVRVSGAVDVDVEHEVLQETFVKAFAPAARAGYDGLRPYRPYLMRIAQHVMIDRFRRRQREPLAVIEDVVDDSVGGQAGGDPGDSLHWRQLSAHAAEFVATLDDEGRRFVALRFEDDLSQDAVAERMGVSRRRVRTLEERVCRGLERALRERQLWPDEARSPTFSAGPAARTRLSRVDQT